MFALYSPGRVGDPRVRAFLDFVVETTRQTRPTNVRAIAPVTVLQRSA